MALTAAPVSEPVAVAPSSAVEGANSANSGAVEPQTPAISAGGAGETGLSSPAEIDARRARQLLERALYLTERGDATGAILACRQAIALAPTAPGGHSMLGLLLERTGDVPHAIEAYEKALQLAPGNAHDNESLERLREKNHNQQGAGLFHFDDAELFEGTTAVAKPENDKKTKKNAVPIPAQEAAPVSSDNSALVVPEPLRISAAAPGLPAESLPQTTPSEATEEKSAISTVSAGAPVFEVASQPIETPLSVGAAVPGEVPAAPVVVPAPEPMSAAAIAVKISTAAAPIVVSSSAAIPVIAERRNNERRQTAMPVPQERRREPERRDTAAPRAARPATPARVSPLTMPGNPAPQDRWSNLRRNPSYFGRSLPLMGATVLSLGFLVWARSFAVARSVENRTTPTAIDTDPMTTDPISTDPAPTNPVVQQNPVPVPNNGSDPPRLPPVGNNPPQNGGFPISNRPLAPASAPVVAPSVPVANAANSTAPTERAPASSAGGTTPRFPRVIPPAPIPPLARQNGAGNDGAGTPASGNGGTLTLPAPVIAAPAPAAAPITVLPPNSLPALNPAGAGGRGYVRITQGHVGTSSLPPRPAAQAGADERGAASASRAGQTDRAIERLSSALTADASDAGFRYQQRATLFLERGDYGRAADDFQSAISAYNDQIGRGEQVASARAGLRAARSGLNLALAGGKR